MSEEAKKDAAAAAEKPKSGGGTSKLIVVAVAFNGLLAAAAVAIPLVRPQPGAHEAKKDDKSDKAGEGEKQEEHAEKKEEHGEKKEEHAEKKEEHGEAKEGDKKEGEGGGGSNGAGPMVQVDNIVVHLRNPEIDRYARVALNIELAKTSDLSTFQSQLPRVRDAVISLLSDKTSEQLTGSEGLNTLKRDLAGRAEEIVGAGRVRGVYLTDFVVQ